MCARHIAVSVGLAAWAAVGLAGKIAPGPGSVGTPIAPVEELAARLSADGFGVETGGDAEARILVARRDTCRVAMLPISPMGWQVHLAERVAWPGARVSFFYEGRLASEFPVWTARLEHYRRRALAQIGRPSAPIRAFGIIADADCPPAESLVAIAIAPGGPRRFDEADAFEGDLDASLFGRRPSSPGYRVSFSAEWRTRA